MQFLTLQILTLVNSTIAMDNAFIEDEDDDRIFSDLNLDEIIALEKSSQEKEAEESTEEASQLQNVDLTFPAPTSTSTSAPKKKFIFQKKDKQPKPSTSVHSAVASIFPPISSCFNVQKASESSHSVDNDFNQSFEDLDISDEELRRIQALEKSARASVGNDLTKANESLGLSPIPAVNDTFSLRQNNPLPYPFPPIPGSVSADKDWKKFVTSLKSDKHFRTPWFQSVPISGLNILNMQTLASSIQNPVHLIQLGNKLVLPFLTDLKAIADSAEEAPNLHKIHDGYFNDILQSLETILTRLEKDVFDPSSSDSLLSQNTDFQQLVQNIEDLYLKRQFDLTKTSVPGTLLRLHPPFLEKLVSSSVKTGNVDLLLPVCSSSQSNLHQVLTTLLSEYEKKVDHSTSDLDGDPDFELKTGSASIYIDVACKLVESLRTLLGSVKFTHILPSSFQTLYSIEVALTSKRNRATLIKDDRIASEILSLLNNVFDDGSEVFSEFILNSLLPIISELLRDKLLTRRLVTYRIHPNLWQYLRRSVWSD